MTLSLIWAQGRNAIIGSGGDLPWDLPEDLARFRSLTRGRPVLMGRATWESLPDPARPLPGRTNIVLTRDQSWSAAGAHVVHDLADAVRQVRAGHGWVIGGAQIYAQTIAVADRLEVTEVDLAPDGDTFAPVIDDQWQRELVNPAQGWQLSATGVRYRFVTYTRAT